MSKKLLTELHWLVIELQSTNSSNEKKEILENYNISNNLKELLRMIYDPSLKYWTTLENLENFEKNEEIGFIDFWENDLINTLVSISNREITGHTALKHILNLWNKYKDYKEMILNIFNKDLKIWLSWKTLNKVFWKGYIKETPYMGAISFNKDKVNKLFKNWKKAFSDIKMDWRYTNVKITEDNIYLESRQGRATDFWNTFKNLIKIRKLFWFDVVLNWELIIRNIDRYKSNWIISSIVSIRDKEEDWKNIEKELQKFQEKHWKSIEEYMNEITIVVWDYIPLKNYVDTATFEESREIRFNTLKWKVLDLDFHNLKIIETKIVNSLKEAMKHFQELVKLWEEWTILKSLDWTWKDWKPSWQIKFKVEDFHDLKIVWFNYWKKWTKNEHLISSILVESEDWLLKTSPGWLKEEEMKMFTENQDSLLWKIAEIKCSGLSQDKDWNYSLLHPSFIKIRDDKTIWANLKKCIEVNESNNNLG